MISPHGLEWMLFGGYERDRYVLNNGNLFTTGGKKRLIDCMLKILVLNKMPEIVLLKLFKSNEWQYCAIYFLQKKMWACTEKKEDESFIHISPFNLELLLKVEFIDK